MAQQILVPLKRDDRVEEIIPYIEEIAKKGSMVVFLIPYPVNGFLWPPVEPRIRATLAARKILERYYTWEEQERLAENKVFLAREALHKRGVEVSTHLYTDRLRRVVESYTRNGDVHLIMMRAGIGLMKRFLYGQIPIFSLFKRPSFTPVLVFHPSHVF